MTQFEISPEEINDILNRFSPGFPETLYCDDGWFPLIIKLNNDLRAIDSEYKIYQIKEKFGGLRFYFEPSESATDEDISHMHELTRQAEDKSFTVCEISGGPGVLMKKDSWVRTLDPELPGIKEVGWEVVKK